MSLPRDREGQAYLSIKTLQAGSAFLPDNLAYKDSEDAKISDDVGSHVPVLTFLITHPTKGKAMFDLGIRKNDGESHPPAAQPTIKFLQARCERDVADILQSDGIDPVEIDVIIYSHLHWDHVGDPAPFTSAEIVLGAEAVSLLHRSYPSHPHSTYMALPSNRRVTYLHFADEHTYLIAPFGPFKRAIDFYGDGSLYLIDTPGHLRGHIAAAARVGPDTFVLLAGDACHGRQCYCPGVREMSTRAHESWEKAQETAGWLATLDKEYPNALVILAHEKERLEEGMPLFPAEINGWVMELTEERKGEANTRAPLTSAL